MNHKYTEVQSHPQVLDWAMSHSHRSDIQLIYWQIHLSFPQELPQIPFNSDFSHKRQSSHHMVQPGHPGARLYNQVPSLAQPPAHLTPRTA